MTVCWEELAGIIGNDAVCPDEPLKNHTTFRIGGPCDCLIRPRTAEQIRQALLWCRERSVPVFVMGNGSNLLVSDAGWHGAVLQLDRCFEDFRISGCEITASAGVHLAKLASAAAQQSLTGLEFASGIPGTLGGAVTMNAGAYGGEMKDVLRQVTVLDEGLEFRTIPAEDLALSYRSSLIQKKDWIVIEAVLSLQEGDRESILERMNELKEKRVSKQPLEYPSAGSTFKRPEGYFAGKLIMDAGLAGYTVGGAQVSEKHCGFVINRGGATAEDVRTLIRDVQRAVEQRFGVRLEPEIRFLGWES